MDKDAEKQKLEDAQGYVQAWLDHPVTVGVLRDLKEQEEGAVVCVCDHPITSIETFFEHFAAVGYLKGLRRARVLVTDELEEIKTKLKELE